MDSPLLWLAAVTGALAAAGALLPLGRRRRLALIGAALLLAPTLIAADNWGSDRFVELRDSPAALVLGGVLAAALVAALVRLLIARPRWLPLLIVAAMPFRVPIELAGEEANLLLPLYAVLAAGVIAAALRPETLLPRPEPRGSLGRLIGPLLAAVIAAYALQAGYADDISTAVENLAFFLIPFAALFLLLSGAEWDRPMLRAAIGVIVAEALLVAAVGFGQALAGEVFWNEKVIDGNEAHPYFRVNSLFFDPNIMGRYLAITMILVAGVVGWGGRRDAIGAALAFGALLVALVLTFSQTSMLALIAGLGVLVVAIWGVWRALLAGAATLAALALVVLALGGGGLTAETTGRTGLVSGGLEIAADRPLTGYGSGAFAEQFESRFGGGDGIAVVSHTEPITVAAEQGLLGLLPYVALLAGSLAALLRAAGLGPGPARDPLAATLLAAYAAMIVHSFGYAAFLSDPITWALLALAVTVPARAPAPASGRQPSSAAERSPSPEAA